MCSCIPSSTDVKLSPPLGIFQVSYHTPRTNFMYGIAHANHDAASDNASAKTALSAKFYLMEHSRYILVT